jgi:phenylalanyl-tRNA synthetase beta chain
MKISLSWLKQYIDVAINVNDLANALTMAGLEVEAVSDRYNYLNRVVIGRLAKIDPHPNADKLKLCRVDIGNRMITVVCGAPNVRTNMLAPCAMPGTCFPKGTILEKNIIRGEASEGMLCSEMELGLSADSDGIMELGPNYSVGSFFNKALGLSDPVLEIDLTPNRPDCLSIIGTAREIAAFQKKKVAYPEIFLPESFDNISDYTSITVMAPELCPRYAASLVFDITVGPSPFWLQDRLVSVGLKPINNIVDITNFVMMETGQPLHAFDFDRLTENRIVVRTAREGEVFITLDGKERPLDPEMLMICDGEKPVALAGVMGGLNSEIEDTTTKVLLESAYFDPVCIRKTSKKTGLNTDASHRFERGVDPNGTLTALNRATQLIVEIGGGKLIKGTIDAYPTPFPEKIIHFSVPALNRRLGTCLDINDVTTHLKSIEFQVDKTGNDELCVIPPSCRVDITRFEDITEEVARLFGYNNIKTTFPLISAQSRQPSKKIELRNRIKCLMMGLGCSEAINYSFISRSSCDRLNLEPNDKKRQVLDVLNPLSEDQSVMRTTLIPGLIETMRYNISVQNRNLKLFEIGNVFFNTGEKESLPDEVEMLAGLWTGKRVDAVWFSREINCDFYDLKGVIEEVLGNLGIGNVIFTRMPPASCFYTKPGFTAQIIIKNEFMGLVGELHPNVLSNYDLKQTAFIFEINFDKLINHMPGTKSVLPIPKFPATSRDITLIVNKDIEVNNILQNVMDLNEELVENLYLFDVFEGDPIPAGRKSISFRITYRSSNETLEDNRTNNLHRSISDRLVEKFDATLPTV